MIAQLVYEGIERESSSYVQYRGPGNCPSIAVRREGVRF